MRLIIATFVFVDWIINVLVFGGLTIPISVMLFKHIDWLYSIVFGLTYGGVLTIMFGVMPMDQELFAKMSDGKICEIQKTENLRWIKKLLWLAFSVAYAIGLVWWLREC